MLRSSSTDADLKYGFFTDLLIFSIITVILNPDVADVASYTRQQKYINTAGKNMRLKISGKAKFQGLVM